MATVMISSNACSNAVFLHRFYEKSAPKGALMNSYSAAVAIYKIVNRMLAVAADVPVL